MKKLVPAALLLAFGCASADPPEPVLVAAPTVAPDPRLGEVQTQLTELLERIDVLNDRVARLEESGAAGGVVQASSLPPKSAPEARTPPSSASREVGTNVPQTALVAAKIAGDYRNAIVLFGQNKLAEARRAFQEVYEADEQGDLADNALFWIGETYFAAKDYVNATRFYMRVTSDYADQNKAPDALFKTALAQERTGDLALARRTLQQVIDRYPYSSAASTAKQELQRIRY